MSSHKPPEAVRRESSLQGHPLGDLGLSGSVLTVISRPLCWAYSPRLGRDSYYWYVVFGTAKLAASQQYSTIEAIQMRNDCWQAHRRSGSGKPKHEQHKYGADSAATGASAINLDPYIGKSIAAIYPSVQHDLSLLWQRPKLPKNAPELVRGWPVFGSVDFYLQRCKFLEKQHKRRKGQPFSLYYGPHLIVGLVGEAGRTLLFNARQFDVRAGYSILLAASPHIETDIDNPALSQVNMFKRILTRERLINSLPKLLEDTDVVFGGLSDREAVVPIFPFMYRLVYKLTHRTGGVHEIAEDEELLDSTLKQFSSMEDCSLLQIMFTGWPLPSMLSKLWAGFKLHRVITGLMKERRRTGRNETDALQFLMNLGETDLEIVKCVIGILFSGLLNTGVNSAWLLSYLANDRMWYNKVQAEVDVFIARHRRTAAESVLDILQRIPYHDWDTQLPVIDVCLRETLRINLYGPAIRKNISDEDVIIPGTDQVVPSKAFAVSN
ncbi:hypothetical protein MY5147_000696 [Beauveria neobassiana]